MLLEWIQYYDADSPLVPTSKWISLFAECPVDAIGMSTIERFMDQHLFIWGEEHEEENPTSIEADGDSSTTIRQKLFQLCTDSVNASSNRRH